MSIVRFLVGWKIKGVVAGGGGEGDSCGANYVLLILQQVLVLLLPR